MNPEAPNPQSHPDAALFVAFEGAKRLATGALAEVAVVAWRAHELRARGPVLVFDAGTGEVVDLDLRGDEATVAARYAPAPPPAPGRGRPKLGVVAREVTLLPRQWDWLARQSGGASVALRRLVDAARKAEGEAGLDRTRREAAYRFMAAVGGDFPGFEEATRALFAGDRDRLEASLSGWPGDVRDQALRFAGGDDRRTNKETP